MREVIRAVWSFHSPQSVTQNVWLLIWGHVEGGKKNWRLHIDSNWDDGSYRPHCKTSHHQKSPLCYFVSSTSMFWLSLTVLPVWCCPVSCGYVVVSDSIWTTACLIRHCTNTLNPLVCDISFLPFPPLLSSSGFYLRWLSPPVRVREYVSAHLFDRSIWPGWWEI